MFVLILTRPFSCDFPWWVGDRCSSLLTFLLDESAFFRGVGLLDLRFAQGVGDIDLCFAKSPWFGLASNFLCGVGLLERFFCSSADCWCCCCVLLPAAVGRWGVGDRERLLEMLLGGACSWVDCRFCTEPTLDAELRRVLGGDDLKGGKRRSYVTNGMMSIVAGSCAVNSDISSFPRYEMSRRVYTCAWIRSGGFAGKIAITLINFSLLIC